MIEITNLVKHFGEKCAVRNLSLSIPEGEIFGFLGPNGAGKTTTIKALTGLIRPTSGSISVGGFDIQNDPLAVKRMLGYIPDTPFLYERLTLNEFLQFTGDLYDVPPATTQKKAQEYLEQFGLTDHANALIRDLSHGMRQRLLYCSAFLHEPKVLCIDEPLMGLDPSTIHMIKDLLIRKAREGMTIFLTTHILALAQDISDRIGIILEGDLVALGKLGELAVASGSEEDLEQIFLAITEPDAPGVTKDRE